MIENGVLCFSEQDTLSDGLKALSWEIQQLSIEFAELMGTMPGPGNLPVYDFAYLIDLADRIDQARGMIRDAKERYCDRGTLKDGK